jgi:hypothetical protein
LGHKHPFNSTFDRHRQSMPTAQNLSSKLLNGRPHYDLIHIRIRRLLDHIGDARAMESARIVNL